METKILNRSIVVVAKDHNPSILHPSFLESQNIVPSGWELAEPPICTPPISIVKYKNGIAFTVEANKLQVLQLSTEEPFEDAVLPNLVSNYVRKLPFVRYTAVGINFTFIAPHVEPENLIVNKFVKERAHKLGDLVLRAAIIKLVYPLEDATLNISCEPRNTAGSQEQTTGILIAGNYHHALRETRQEEMLDDALKAISTFEQRYQHFKEGVIPELL